ncbi:hypothetical protein ACKWTF_007933 [Chironomus riparius]
MEAVKRLPMVCFDIKNSPESTSFHNLKQCIAEYYGEDPESYTKEFRELEELRGLACRPRVDIDCCNTIKRYYSQLHSLQNRFPLSSETELLNFAWKDIYSGSIWHTSNIRYEMASTLYNVAALHSKLGIEEERVDPESMKLACTHFQCAAWAFGEIKNQYGLLLRSDLSAELMIFMQQICFAQAQECILEKSLADNRKAGIIAKVTAQVISFYNAAMSALFSQNEDGTIQELIGNKLYKEWIKYIKFKTSYLSSILFLYQGQHSEEQRKMGERLALYNAACDRLEEAKKETKGMNKIEIINEALVLATDIIEGKRKNAKQENEFIYHEVIPDISTISAVQGANLVQGISFDVTDPQIIGEDIFKRLVPMKAHENLSLYSEEKAQILRRLSAKIDERDAELSSFMGSLNIDLLNSMKQSQIKLPQNLVDRCAELNAKPNAISDLIESMSNLGNICAEVEMSLNEIKQILDEEGKQEQNFQKQIGKRPSVHMSELTREFTKYLDAHSKAGESNDTLRKAMELHVSNLKILAQPLSSLKSQVPQSDVIDEEVRKELEVLLNKVEEMKVQRDEIYNELRDQILNKDDITSQLIAHGDKDVEELFKKELKKYSQSVNIIEQNLIAQGNILKALTDTYAKHAMSLKAFNDAKSKREQYYSSLINSFDVYEDLLSKSSKGLDFYKKLYGNIQKLMSRVKAARDVQEEERQQLLKKTLPKAQQIDKPDNAMKLYPDNSNVVPQMNTQIPQSTTTGMKLKDYIKSGLVPNIGNIRDETKIPAIRPNPLGEENISSTNITACSTANYPTAASYNSQQYYQQQMYPNQQYYQPQMQNSSQIMNQGGNKIISSAPTSNYSSTTTTGYVNPMYQNNQMYDMNTYNQNYSSYQAQYQQPVNQKPISTSFPSTPTSSQQNNFTGYYNNQQVSQNSVMPNQNTSQQNVSQNQTINPVVQSSNNQNVSTPYSASSQYYQQQPTNGDFIQNIYKSHLQYPTAQSPIQNYPTTSTPSSTGYINNSVQNPAFQASSQSSTQTQNPQQQYSNLSGNYQPQTSQQSVQNYQYNQYGQIETSQNYPYSSPTSMANISQGTQSNPQSQVTQSSMYYQNNNIQNSVTPQSINSSVSIQNQSVPSSEQQNTMSMGNAQPQVTQSNMYYQNMPGMIIFHTMSQSNSLQNMQAQPNAYNYANNAQTTQVPAQQNTQFPTQNIQDASQNIQAASQNIHTAPQNNQAAPVQTTALVAPNPAIKSNNIDLLSDIDFSIPSSTINNIPLLTPITPKKDETKEVKESPKKVAELPKPINQSQVKLNDDLADLDFSSLTMTMISPQIIQPKVEELKKFEDPFDDVNVLKQFHKEVESLEKYMETLTVKTLNGITPLANKWKELQDLLVKDESSRSISIAKLFPDKNRYADFLPYDHGRVLLPTSTDNYINAAMVRNCGPVSFIMAQIPMENTMNDYWEMIWSQKSNVLVCLYSSSELLDPFWPQNINDEKSYGEVIVTLIKQFELSHCFEKQLKVTKHGSDKAMEISLIQVKNWKKKSADHILDVSNNVITSFKQNNPGSKQYPPIVLNCISGGSDRSGLMTLAISAIFATQMKKPTLLNVVDHWFRVCSQRKGVLDDESYLQLSLQLVLNNSHRILNKRKLLCIINVYRSLINFTFRWDNDVISS